MEKITITPLDGSGNPQNDKAFAVLFNPGSYSVSKSVSWSAAGAASDRRLNAPVLTFNGGGSRTLNLELFYDATEMVSVGGLPTLITDVREETNRMVELTRLGPDGAEPPVVEVSWGDSGPTNSDFPFQGVVSSLNQTFSLFEEDGTPLRATLAVSFTEFRKSASATTGFSVNTLTRAIRAGDRLEGLAALHLNDPKAWRSIASANNIDDPRKLVAGARLSVPKV